MTVSATRPRPFDDSPFLFAGDSPLCRGGVQVYRRYRAISNALHTRYTALLVAASQTEASGELPSDGSYAHHLAHNWHLCAHGETCATSRVLLRYRRLSNLLFHREARERHNADHAWHVLDGGDGRYLWCDGCSRGPSRCIPTSGFMLQDFNVALQAELREDRAAAIARPGSLAATGLAALRWKILANRVEQAQREYRS